MRQNLSLVFLKLQRLAKNEITPVASLDMILSKSDNKGADAQAGQCLCCLQTPKTGFLASTPK